MNRARSSAPSSTNAAAAGLAVAYAATAFGWRMWRHWRRTGDTGFRLSARSAPAAHAASLLITGGGALAFIGPLARNGQRCARWDAPRPVRGAGLVVMALAIAGTARAQLDMGQSWRIGVDDTERTDLVTGGAFARSRNPIFAWGVAFSLGSALAAPGPLTVLGAAAVLAGVELQVRGIEEPYLLAAHGDAYREYAMRVGRFVPRIGRSAPA
jgi:protein-S-isoprenylcysteine O-methyltransferase Ste14